MLFNSIEFAIFLPIVFLLYWFVFQKNLKLQNLFIVVVSYIFYGWWDWRFVTLAYRDKYPSITQDDLHILQVVFGEENVYDFSGREDITLDWKYFSDPNHFGLNIGWQMLEKVYHG